MGGTANPGWSKAKYAARGVHLDQDTAGRLLESMGDYARREMIVRSMKVFRQNPAYRSLADVVQPPTEHRRRLFLFAVDKYRQESGTMPLKNKTLVLLPFLVIGCASPAGRSLPPIPEPGRQEPAPQVPSAHSWSFNYTPGVASYRVTRSAAIESASEPSPSREV